MITFNRNRKRDRQGRKESVFSKIGATLFFLIFLVMGLFFEVLIVKDTVKSVKSHSWTKTECTILTSSVAEKPGDKSPYVFQVSYEYEYGSVKYTSRVYRLGYNGSSEYDKAHKPVEMYPAGESSFCYVNPAKIQINTDFLPS